MLSGGAIAVALPLFDCLLNTNGTAYAATNKSLPTRFGTWFWGCGMDPQIFVPTTVGAEFDLPEQLAALKNVKQHLNVFTNFRVLTDGSPNLCHYTGWVGLRCGAAPSARGELPEQSLDYTIADTIGAGTRFRQLNFAATGNPRHSYSFKNADAISLPETSAIDVYRKIFGPDFQDPNSPTFTPDPRTMVRKSVLSGVLEQGKALNKELGTADRARLDQHFTAIRELESRLELQLQKPPPAPQCVIPASPPPEIPVGIDSMLVAERHNAMTDLLVMALVCNQTRVFNMVYSDSASNVTRRGFAKTHHAATHEEPLDPKLGYQIENAWFVGEAMKCFAYFLESLAKQPEGDGSLLDHMLVYAHSDQEVAKVHSLNGIPMLTAGGANGLLKTGIHIDGAGEPGTRLGYTLQRVLGVPITDWGYKSLRTSLEIGEILA
ncbi:MAG: DUF1552 domain-containing protein [Gammaproteobacteria bacterium]|nr:DUF1552 domain-containing protein [Gammaproteobacteria bacterium]